MNQPATSAPLPPTAEAALTCKNCGFVGAGRFCQVCGQRFATHRITVPHLLHEVFHFFTHVEAGLLFTLKELVRRPGYMERDYLAGRQVGYQRPFSCFFLACTITALGQFAVRTLVQRWYGVADDGEHFFRHYFSLLQAVLLPVYTLITWAFFRRARYNYAEVMVVVLYTLSLLLYMTLLLNALRLLWPHFDTRYVELPLIVGYNTLTYLRLYPEASRGAVITKSLLINSGCFALAQVAQYAAIHLLGH